LNAFQGVEEPSTFEVLRFIDLNPKSTLNAFQGMKEPVPLKSRGWEGGLAPALPLRIGEAYTRSLALTVSDLRFV
jgi:hypothetical protein